MSPKRKKFLIEKFLEDKYYSTILTLFDDIDGTIAWNDADEALKGGAQYFFLKYGVIKSIGTVHNKHVYELTDAGKEIHKLVVPLFKL